jgi:RNA-directed DNA polymerase
LPAVKSENAEGRQLDIRRWALHHHSDKSLQEDLANNPYIQGWINYYGRFYRRSRDRP